jgi:hypothetical protein
MLSARHGLSQRERHRFTSSRRGRDIMKSVTGYVLKPTTCAPFDRTASGASGDMR